MGKCALNLPQVVLQAQKKHQDNVQVLDFLVELDGIEPTTS